MIIESQLHTTATVTTVTDLHYENSFYSASRIETYIVSLSLSLNYFVSRKLDYIFKVTREVSTPRYIRTNGIQKESEFSQK